MPRRDGSGPNGMGSRTGRGLGMCTGVNAPGFGRGFGAGYGMGRFGNGPGYGFRGGRNGWGGYGRGFGRGGWWDAAPAFAGAYEETPETLEERAAFLESELKAVQQRVAEMKKDTAE